MVLYNAAARHAAVGADPPERYTGPLATKRWRRESDRLLVPRVADYAGYREAPAAPPAMVSGLRTPAR